MRLGKHIWLEHIGFCYNEDEKEIALKHHFNICRSLLSSHEPVLDCPFGSWAWVQITPFSNLAPQILILSNWSSVIGAEFNIGFLGEKKGDSSPLKCTVHKGRTLQLLLQSCRRAWWTQAHLNSDWIHTTAAPNKSSWKKIRGMKWDLPPSKCIENWDLTEEL